MGMQFRRDKCTKPYLKIYIQSNKILPDIDNAKGVKPERIVQMSRRSKNVLNSMLVIGLWL